MPIKYSIEFFKTFYLDQKINKNLKPSCRLLVLELFYSSNSTASKLTYLTDHYLKIHTLENNFNFL